VSLTSVKATTFPALHTGFKAGPAMRWVEKPLDTVNRVPCSLLPVTGVPDRGSLCAPIMRRACNLSTKIWKGKPTLRLVQRNFLIRLVLQIEDGNAYKQSEAVYSYRRFEMARNLLASGRVTLLPTLSHWSGLCRRVCRIYPLRYCRIYIAR
jgi:hypothetical protein